MLRSALRSAVPLCSAASSCAPGEAAGVLGSVASLVPSLSATAAGGKTLLHPVAAGAAQQWRSNVFVVNVQKNNVDQAYGALSKSMREAGGCGTGTWSS